MKRLLIIILFLAGISFAQETGKIVGNSIIFTDSIGYSGSDAGDSVLTIKTDFKYDWTRAFIKGNANSPVDSIGVRFGSIRYEQIGISYFPVDTIWGSWFATMKDSAYNNCARIINNTVGKDYFFLAPSTQLTQFAILNHRATRLTRETKLTIQFINAIKD